MLRSNLSFETGMRLELYRDIDLASAADRLDKNPCWADLQGGVRIVWTANGDPVRQILPRSRLPVGRYNSRKAGRMLHHQSRGHGYVGGEKLALMRCEINPAVADFRSQHIRFDLLVGGAAHTYFPHIIALFHDGTIIVVEVKKDGRWQSDPVYRAKIEAVREICSDLGWRFEIWTQKTMAPTSHDRDNIAQIQMQRFVRIDEVQTLLVARAFQRNDGRIPVSEIKRTIGGMPGAGDLVRGLMCRGCLELPLGEVIQDSTIATAFNRCVSPRLEHSA